MIHELRLGSNINPAMLTGPPVMTLEGQFSEANLNEPSPMDIWTEHSDDSITQNIANSLIDPAASSAMSQSLLDF